MAASSDDSILVCNYTSSSNPRITLFTIVSGYSKDKDLLLLIDSKFSTRWLPLTEMWNRFHCTTLLEDGKSNCNNDGGYLVIRNNGSPVVSLLVSSITMITLDCESAQVLYQFNEEWKVWLMIAQSGNQDHVIQDCVFHICAVIKTLAVASNGSSSGKPKKHRLIKYLSHSEGSLLETIMKLKMFSAVQDVVSALSEDQHVKLTKFVDWILEVLFVVRNVKSDKKLNTKKKRKLITQTINTIKSFSDAAVVTIWLTFWPYQVHFRNVEASNTNYSLLADYMQQDLDTLPECFVSRFHQQFNFLFDVLPSSV